MKKSIFITFLLILAVVSGFAKQAGQSAIRKVAVSFYYEHARLTEGLSINSIGIKEMIPTSFNGRIVYYTIRLNPGGWIVVSADDAVTPVLAYSYEDNLDLVSLPPQYVSWMEKYRKQIDDVVSRNLQASEEISSKWAKYTNFDPNQAPDVLMTTGVAPLIIHNWDQGYPYNIYCPIDPAGPGNHPYAGCVATAMSQVMYYYRYPQTGNGQHCYYPSGYPQQCANFGATNYNWNAMVNSLNGARLQNDSAVALLLWHAGVSVDMMYGAGSSGAYSDDARNAMVNYFRFSSNASYLQRDNYTDQDWDNIMKSNLDKKMPIYYDGYGSSGGHAFNCDGYEGTDHFHFNWGWSGNANGYYYLNNLNPSGYNFSQGEGAIVNLFPDTLANTYPYTCQSQTVLKSIAGTFDDGSGPALGYRANSQCSWLVAPESVEDSIESISLNFNSFSTSSGTDILRVYKGSSSSDSLVGEFSGNTFPPLVNVNGPKALVTFNTGASSQGEGWLISYTSKVMDWCLPVETMSDTVGIISDGSMHFNYHNSSVCRWKIAPAGIQGPLNLVFTSFRTQENHDVVTIYDYVSGDVLAEYSGIYNGSNLPGPVTASSGQMFIIFSTDQTVTEAGWEARYSTIVGCDELSNSASVQVYPNPAHDFINVHTGTAQNSAVQAELSNINGVRVLKQRFDQGSPVLKINLSGLNAGMYFLRVSSETGSAVRKVVVE